MEENRLTRKGVCMGQTNEWVLVKGRRNQHLYCMFRESRLNIKSSRLVIFELKQDCRYLG